MLRQRGLAEIHRVIREVDPQRPSTRVTGPGAIPPKRPATGTPSPDISRDCFARISLDHDEGAEKDRTRRYDTAVGLANDVRRYLRHEPVMAGPPSAMYRSGKFVRRHRFGVWAAAALVVLLAVAVAMANQARRIARERDRANQESSRATREAEAARQVSEFLIRLFELSARARPGVMPSRCVDLDTAPRGSTRAREQPELRSRLMATMGQAYQSLGLYGGSEALSARAWTTRNTAGLPPGGLAESLNSLGVTWCCGAISRAASRC